MVLNRRKKHLPAPFGAISGNFPTGRNNAFFRFFRPIEKLAPDGPKWGQEDFFLLIQTLPTFWATWILILRFLFFFLIFWLQKFQISRSQISRFPELWPGPGLGQPQAGPGPETAGAPSAAALDHKVGEIQGTRTIP